MPSNHEGCASYEQEHQHGVGVTREKCCVSATDGAGSKSSAIDSVSGSFLNYVSREPFR